MTVRTRFAPSPTGFLHIGGVRTALFNYLYAKRHGGQFLLRIDDTDQARHVEGAVELILEGFRWMGMQWDEGPEVGGPYGPYYQAQRSAVYEKALEELIAAGAAYPCLATDKELDALRQVAKASKVPFVYRGPTRDLPPDEVLAMWKEKKPALRFKVPLGKTTKLADHVRGDVEWQTDLLGDFTLTRAGGHPLYNFVSIVDDVAMKITHIIRAEEHLSNTHPQLLIAQALSATLPEFAHVPYVAKTGTKEKISKRDKAARFQMYVEEGYLSDALFNALARLGWSLDDHTEVMSRETIVSNFSLDRITNSPGALDPDKLFWFQDQHMRLLPVSERVEKMIPFLRSAGLVGAELSADDKAKLAQIVEAAGDRLKVLGDIVRYADYLFRETAAFDAKAAKTLQGPDALKQLEALKNALEARNPFDVPSIESAAHAVGQELGVGGKINHVLRAAATGRSVGAGVYDCIAILGKKKTLANFAKAEAAIASNEFPLIPE
ncbi:MAG TPA: glutamate--tRNA ligase [Planctomycetia bacterium]|nr:glutamate--tRNA ligase [Planctomycetia bacterium]